MILFHPFNDYDDERRLIKPENSFASIVLGGGSYADENARGALSNDNETIAAVNKLMLSESFSSELEIFNLAFHLIPRIRVCRLMLDLDAVDHIV